MSKNARLKMTDFKGSGGKDVFLRANAFDLSVVTAAIVERVEQVRETLNGRPLVILMGEDHRIASHVILQLLTLSKLHGKYKQDVGFGTELPYNLAVPSWIKRGHTSAEAKMILAADHDGQATLKEILNRDLCVDALHSHGALLTHCLRKSISTCFADAAGHGPNSELIDCEDDRMREVVGNKRFEGISFLKANTSLGVNVRNIFMSSHVVSHIKFAGVKCMIMGVGAAHVFGLHNKFSFDGSLACQFEKADMPFIAVLPFGQALSIHHIPADASRFFGQTIGVIGMDETAFPQKKIGKEVKDENAYIVRIIEATGGLAKIPTPT